MKKIKVFNLNGEKIKEINNSNICAFFIDTYYDLNSKKLYIITGNLDCTMSYDFHKNEIYHKYFDNKNKYDNSVMINNNEEIVKMIDSCVDGIISRM